MENRNENGIRYKEQYEFYKTNKEAFEDISSNFNNTESFRRVASNNGWKSATDEDVKALLYHFLESQVDIHIQQKKDICLHFKRWLNKQPSENLITLSKKIHERLSA